MGCRFFSFWFLTASCILGKRSGEGCWMFSGEEAQASFYTEKLENDGKAWKYGKRKRCRGVGRRHGVLSQQQISSSLDGDGKRITLFSSSRVCKEGAQGPDSLTAADGYRRCVRRRRRQSSTSTEQPF